jgi:hypothetical protein
VPARVPLDVDLEDRVIYGLSPQRLAYAALALLAAMAAWHALPGPSGPVVAVLTAAAGAALAWGGWAGRGLDAWLLAIARYAIRTYRVELDAAALTHFTFVRPRPRLARPPRQPPSEWRPRLVRTTEPPTALRVVGGWDPDP